MSVLQSTTILSPNPSLSCEVLKKTRDFLFLKKPSKLHSIAHDFSETETVANWLLAVDPSQKKYFSNSLEAGLAHRLDFETSGVMVAARNPESYTFLRKAFKESHVRKIYQCVIEGAPPSSGFYQAFAGAKTNRKVMIRSERRKGFLPIATEILSHEIFFIQNKKFSLVTLQLISGFRHQIRAHMAFLKKPLVGDSLYGGLAASRLLLHAESLEFRDRQGIIQKAVWTWDPKALITSP